MKKSMTEFVFHVLFVRQHSLSKPAVQAVQACVCSKHMKNTHGIVQALRQPYAQLDQPAASIDAQPVRQSVIQFAPRITRPPPQEHIQITPQIFVPDVPAGDSDIMSEDEICIAAMDEFENEEFQNDYTG